MNNLRQCPKQKTKVVDKCADRDIKLYLNNSYRLIQSKNYDQFLYTLGVRKEIRKIANNLQPTIKLTKKHKKYTLTTKYSPDRIERIIFELGKPILRELENGSLVTSLFLRKGNVLEEMQCLDKNTITITRSFNSEFVIVKMSTDKEQCQRMYKRVVEPEEDDVMPEDFLPEFSSSTGSISISDEVLKD